MPAATATDAPDFAHAQYQLGMVNPPRRVKRLREIALRDPSSSTANIIPSISSSSSSPPQAASPPASTAAPRRRGRKPAGPMSKSAREQLRKTNHSVIEKRRREKINEALAALRELVPHDQQQEGERKEDKEFKLEVLVRTVEYLRVMLAKVKNLEGAMCQKCGGALQGSANAAEPSEDDQPSRAVKRKRTMYHEETSVEDLDNESRHTDAALSVPTYPKFSTDLQPPQRLPSISSWMAMYPPVSGPSPLANSHAYQLPSPPHTAPFAPTTTTSSGFPPRLVLPSPIAPSSPSAPIRYRGPNSSHQGSSPLPERTSSSASFDSFTTRDRDVPELPLDTPLRSPAIDHRHMLVDPSPPTSMTVSKSTPATALPPISSFHTPSETSSDADAHCRSPVSPWSRDDQTAASLLLHISSRPRHSRAGSSGSWSEPGSERGPVSGSASASASESISGGAAHRQIPNSPRPLPPLVQEHHLKTGAGARMGGRPGARRGGGALEAHTPSSVLGMGEGSGGVGGDASTRSNM